MSGKYDLRHFRGYNSDYAQILHKICDIAETAVGQLPAGAERNAGLRKLLEASDCFKRAVDELNHHASGQQQVRNEVKADSRYGVDPVSGQPLPKDSPYAPVSFRDDDLIQFNPSPGAAIEFHRRRCNRVVSRGGDCNCDHGKSDTVRHEPGCAINTPPYFPEQCNCGAVK